MSSPANAGPFSTWDLQQVEILRGPQSTQKGRNALAGAINIRSADPVFETTAKARFDAAQFDSSRAAMMFNTPLVADKLAIRIAAEQYRTDGWIDNVTRNTDRQFAQTNQMARAKLLWKPTQRLTALLTYHDADNRQGRNTAVAALFPDSRATFSNEIETRKNRHRIANLELNYQINPQWAISSNSNYYKQRYQELEDTDNSPIPDNRILGKEDNRTLSQELKIIYDNQNNLTGAVGLYYADLDLETDFVGIAPGGILDPGNPIFAGTTISGGSLITEDVQNIALFTEFDYLFAERWTLIVGGRYERETRELTEIGERILEPAVIDLSDETTVVSSETTFDAFLPKLGIKYAWTEDLQTGFTVQRGYRAGGSQRNFLTRELSEFEPEYTWNYELALRSFWLDRRLAINTNLFYTDWTDQQVNVSEIGATGLTDFRTVNAGESEIYGMEFEIRYRPNQRLDLFANAGYAHTEFKQFVSEEVDLSGTGFPMAPEWTLSAGGRYRFAEHWLISLNGHYADQHFDTAGNIIDSRFVMNTRFGYEEEHWAAYLYARNVLNEDYENEVDINGTFLQLGEPRTLGLQLQANF